MEKETYWEILSIALAYEHVGGKRKNTQPIVGNTSP